MKQEARKYEIEVKRNKTGERERERERYIKIREMAKKRGETHPQK